jgi:hypothetical protein
MTDGIVARLNSSYAFLGDPLHKEAADEILHLREALLDILRTFDYAPRGAYKARYFAALGFARRALRAKGMKIGYSNVIALLDAAEEKAND